MQLKTDRRKFLLGTSAALAAGAVAWPQGARAATTLDLSQVLPNDNWQTIEMRRFADAVQEATNGEVVIRVHSGGSLGFKGPEHLRAVADGLVPMADLLGAQQSGEVPLFKLENLPFLIRDQADMAVLHQFWRPVIDEIVETRYNQKFLTAMPSPTNYLYMNVLAEDIEDLRNLRVRGAAMIDVEIFDLIGLAGIQIPWGELIPALATGRVEGVGTSPTSAVDGKFWEFMKYIYPTNHVWASNFLTVNLDAWNGLSESNRETILALAEEYQPQFWATSKRLGEEAFGILTSNGMEIVDMPDGMLEEMQTRTRPAIDQYIAEVPEAGPIIAAYFEAVGRS